MTCKMSFRVLILFVAVLNVSSSFAQDNALQQLIHGKKFFWEAKFNQALGSLKKVTETPDAKREYLFEAYLYTGFVLLRQNAPMAETRSVFSEAIALDPRRKLDEMVIPPDLTEPFYQVRDELVGCLHVITFPDEVDIVGVQGDSVLFDETTPITICDLVARDYQLLLSEDGFQQEFIPLELTAGKTDTMEVALKSTHGDDGGKSGLVKWAIRGGIVLGVAGIVYKTVLESKGEELPAPPAHPAGSQ